MITMQQLTEFALKHWLYIIALGFVSLLMIINETLGRKNRARAISPKAAVNLINHESAVLLDIRTPEDFRKAHIIDSILTDETKFEKKQLEKHKSKPMIIVCQRGIKSQQFAMKAKLQGFDNIYVLSGGIQAWIEAELPLVK